MPFLALGSEKIGGNSSSGIVASSLIKKLVSNNTWSTFLIDEADQSMTTNISKSSWTESGSYKYLSLGVLKQSYSEIFNITRDRRFNGQIKFTKEVVPNGTSYDEPKLYLAAVKGLSSDTLDTAVTTFVTEYISGTFNNTLAYTELGEYINEDVYSSTYDSNLIYKGSANIRKEYDLPITENLFLIIVAIAPNSIFTNITSLTYSISMATIVEYIANNSVPYNSVGESEIKDSYHAELARSNWMINVEDPKYVEYSGKLYLLVTSEYAHSFKENGIYNLNILVNESGLTTEQKAMPVGLSLGYYDAGSSTWTMIESNAVLYKSDGTTTVTWSDVASKFLQVAYIGSKFIILNSVSKILG